MKEKAKEFALEAHGDQSYGDKPYSYHLNRVVSVLERFGRDSEDLVCAAYLHDVVEDTDVTSDEVEERFGSSVAAMVECVTKEDSKEATYAKMAKNRDAVVLKLADRIANVEECVAKEDSLFRKYRREHSLFKGSAHEEGHAEDMWAYLDSLLSDSDDD